jgi:hypothetical protein
MCNPAPHAVIGAPRASSSSTSTSLPVSHPVVRVARARERGRLGWDSRTLGAQHDVVSTEPSRAWAHFERALARSTACALITRRQHHIAIMAKDARATISCLSCDSCATAAHAPFQRRHGAAAYVIGAWATRDPGFCRPFCLASNNRLTPRRIAKKRQTYKL